MYAAITGSRARMSIESSYIGSHMSFFFIVPVAYFFANFDSRCIAMIAAENIDIGCESRGIARSTSNTYWGTAARAFQSSTISSV